MNGITRKQLGSVLNTYQYGLRIMLVIQAIFFAIEIITLTIGFLSVTVKKQRVYPFVVVVAILAHVVHIVASILELVRCTSILCMKNNGFLIAITVLFGFLIIVESVILFYISKLNKYSKIKI